MEVPVAKRAKRPPAASEEERRERARIYNLEWRHRNPERERELERRKREDPYVRARKRMEAYRSYQRKRERWLAAGWVPGPRGRPPSVNPAEIFSVAYGNPSNNDEAH